MRAAALVVVVCVIGCEPSAEERCEAARRAAAGEWERAHASLVTRANGLESTAERLDEGGSIFATEPTAIVITAGETESDIPEDELARQTAQAIEAQNRATRMRAQADVTWAASALAQKAAETPTDDALDAASALATDEAVRPLVQRAVDRTETARSICAW